MGKSFFSITDPTTVYEGNTATFWITRAGDTSRNDRVTWRTQNTWGNNSASYSSSNYNGTIDYERAYSRYVYFRPGETSKQLTVQTYDDAPFNIIEGEEKYNVILSDARYGYTSPSTGRTNYYSNSRLAGINDGVGDGLILDNDSGVVPTVISSTPTLVTPVVVTTTPTVDNSTTTATNTTTNNVDNSINNTVTQNFNITITGDNNSMGSFGNTQFEQTGTQGADILTGNSALAESDIFRGMAGDDKLTGYRGADLLVGDAGNDILRGGNGRDVLTGGVGGDTIYGGFGQNTFTGELDGAVDRLYFKSDHLASNWLYGKAGNQNGNKVDVIGQLDSFDRIYVEGAPDFQLSYGATTATVQGQSVSGIGIFADNTLEAIYTGGNLTSSQLDAMTMGVPV